MNTAQSKAERLVACLLEGGTPGVSQLPDPPLRCVRVTIPANMGLKARLTQLSGGMYEKGVLWQELFKLRGDPYRWDLIDLGGNGNLADGNFGYLHLADTILSPEALQSRLTAASKHQFKPGRDWIMVETELI